ncbi:methyltransferase domain-containing protein [Nocardia rhizosphaerihabitans]|uniref:methyltransferase domain-containing protein n=1 Tax=Nocardia rhizosphaerihabitans TaxID=1691570 RepID=UPI00366E60F7
MAVPEEQLPSFRADDAGVADDFLVTLLDLQAELPGVVRMRHWVLEALAPRPGESALDIGSGTGSEVLAFAERVGPHGRAVGVDPNPAMLAVARQRASGTAAEYLEGTVRGAGPPAVSAVSAPAGRPGDGRTACRSGRCPRRCCR